MSIHVGIDTGKSMLDVGFYPDKRCERFANTAEGHRALLLALAPLDVPHIAIEATGGYERGIVDALAQAGYCVTRLASHRATAFARAMGSFAKSDALDAQVLARMAAHITPQPYEVPAAERAELAELVRCRLQMVSQRDDNKRRLLQTRLATAQRALRGMIEAASMQIRELDRCIATATKAADPASRLREVPGIGPVAEATLIAYLPELGRLTRQQIAALVGWRLTSIKVVVAMVPGASAPVDGSSGVRCIWRPGPPSGPKEAPSANAIARYGREGKSPK